MKTTILTLAAFLFSLSNCSSHPKERIVSKHVLVSDTIPKEESWEVYLAQFEKGPGSVIVNMSAKSYAPHKKFPFVLVAGVAFKPCNSNGLPNDEQFPALNAISDHVQKALTSIAGNVAVGTFTYQCERLDYYYVTDTNGLRNKLSALYASNYKDYTPYINIKNDVAWQTYLEFLYPSKEIQEYMSNQKIFAALMEAGDKLNKPRQVDHWIYFANDNDRDCFIKYAQSQGFKIEEKEKVKVKGKRLSLQISRTEKMEMNSINTLNLLLRKEAEKCNGDYDGWETFVVKE